TYGFLPPQAGVRFTEYWMPVREIGGITRANLHGVLHLARKDGALAAALNVNHEIRDARIRITAGAKVLFESRATLTPARGFSESIASAPPTRCTFELSDAAGAPLLVHTEEQYDWRPPA